MKLSETWLREWVNPSITSQALCHELTMAGLEVEDITPVSGHFDQVVVGRIEHVEAHPSADRLRVCQVNVGTKSILQIVCGAANARTGLVVPVALAGATLPGEKKIHATELRGVPSQGMLCSAVELGLSEENNGLFELPSHFQLGKAVKACLQLDDNAINIAITPNRGDCLSVAGLAREVAAITKATLKTPLIQAVKAKNKNKPTIKIDVPAACPVYVGRIISGISADMASPIWLTERLRRSGIRTISPVVDVTNYVMLELGQPMHAFDLATLQKGIRIRYSKQGEQIDLLDGSKQRLDGETLVIADNEKPLAIAGVMGGMNSCVTTLTQDILLESAWFEPKVIARQRQYYQLDSDSAYRFERGVDSTIQRVAIERATRLIMDIAGGEPGPIVECRHQSRLPKIRKVSLSQEKLSRLTGMSLKPNLVTDILKRLQFQPVKARGTLYSAEKKGWSVLVPPFRHDISVSEDLIEEVLRIHGYDHVPVHSLSGDLTPAVQFESDHDIKALKVGFSHHGFHEVVTYSFVDRLLQSRLDPAHQALSLLNPITAEMAVMRTSLWPGLINTYIYNRSRQVTDMKLIEVGECFYAVNDYSHPSVQRIGGLMSGLAVPEQWGVTSRQADFFDLKGHLNEVIRGYTGWEPEWRAETHPALHPGQTAALYQGETRLGVMGSLHPALREQIGLEEPVFLFELETASLVRLGKTRIDEVSRFPDARRDIAILVNETVPAARIQDIIKSSAGDWLKEVFIFDLYHGKGISPGQKSLALALIWQHPARTLVDDEVTSFLQGVIKALKEQLGAELRS